MTIPTLPWEFYSFTWEWIQYLAFWTQFISLIKCILNSILLSPDISMRISFYFSDNIQSEIGKFFWYFSSWIFFVRLLTHSHEVHSVFIYPFMVIKVYVYLPFGFLNFFYIHCPFDALPPCPFIPFCSFATYSSTFLSCRQVLYYCYIVRNE